MQTYIFNFIPALLLVIFAIAMAEENLELQLTAEKSAFQLGEPVIVYLTVANTGSDPVNMLPFVYPEVDIYHYYIIDPDGQEIAFSPLYVDDHDTSMVLNQGGHIRGAARIFYGGHGYYFKTPGSYKVLVRYKDMQSNLLKITVRTPRNDAEQSQAALILDHPEVGLFLMLEGGDELKDAIQQIETMKREYPNSLLTAYLKYAEAKNYSVPARNFVTKKPRGADITRSVEILETLKDQNLQMYYRSKIFVTLSGCLLNMERGVEAKRVLEELQQIFEDEKASLKPFFMDKIRKDIERL